MKTRNLIRLAIVLCVIGPYVALAQFTSGSTGSDGPLNVTSNTTLTLPPNGIFNFTTINVPVGFTLKFTRNVMNTPVYLLASGDVVISGLIDVSGDETRGRLPGAGGPGGFDGGYGAYQGFPDGDGQGPGGGLAIDLRSGGGYAFSSNGNTNAYGNTLLSPLIGGSGGGAAYNLTSFSGGGGGGAILIASTTRVTINNSGSVRARGGAGFGGGSGGAIRIVAPVIDGNGNLDVLQGDSNFRNPQNSGSVGRTRIDCIDRFSHRNLTMGGKATRGIQMFVFPPGNPHLDIISAAGTPIPEGTNAPVTVILPVGSSTNQIVRVQARGFTNDIPIRVRITPENASSATFDAVIQQSSGNPPFADVPVIMPLDTVCYVHAWTR